MDLLLGLHNAELGSGEQTATDELQAVVLVLLLHRQSLAHEHLYLTHEADEQQRVDDVEGCVEGRELEQVVATTHHAVDKPADGIACGIEHDEENHHAKHVEEHMGEGGTACLRVGSERGHEGRDGGADVLSHGQGSGLLESEAWNVHAEEHQRDGHRGG